MTSPGDAGRIDTRAVGKGDQEILIAEHMFEHAGKKVGILGCLANDWRRNARGRDKAGKPGAILGNKGKRLNRQHFGVFSRMARVLCHLFGEPVTTFEEHALALLARRSWRLVILSDP